MSCVGSERKANKCECCLSRTEIAEGPGGAGAGARREHEEGTVGQQHADGGELALFLRQLLLMMTQLAHQPLGNSHGRVSQLRKRHALLLPLAHDGDAMRPLFRCCSQQLR